MSLLSTAFGVLTQLVSQLMEMRLATHTMRTFARSEMDASANAGAAVTPSSGEDARARSNARACEQRAPTGSDLTHPTISRA